MKMTFNSWYVAIISAGGLIFLALAMTAYVTGHSYLLCGGIVFFTAVTVTMSSTYAQRQNKARKVAGK